MLQLKITQEHRIARETARKFCQKEIEPKIPELESGKESIIPLIKKFLHQVEGTGQIKTIEELESWAKNRDFITQNLISIEVSKCLPGFALSRGGKAGAGCQADGNRCWHQSDSALDYGKKADGNGRD